MIAVCLSSSQLNEMNVEIIKFHKDDRNNHKILMKYASLSAICLKVCSHLFFIVSMVSFSFGIIMSVYTKSLVLSFGFEIPFINLQSFHGFIINHLFQDWSCFVGYKGFTGFIRIYFSLFIHACTEIDIIIDQLSAFNSFIIENFENCEIFEKESARYLVTILKMHKENNL